MPSEKQNIQPLLLTYPGNESFSAALHQHLNFESVEYILRSFPDAETYLRILSDVAETKVAVLCSLVHPNEKFLPLYFLCKALKEQGAKEVGLIAPYLAYLRQDKIFQSGETITSRHFATLLSETLDWLITVDPHLHRYSSLAEIYKIPTMVLHADNSIAEWIKNNITNPILIGPDSESEQWVSEVAKKVGTPHLILQKVRKGDREVELSLPSLQNFQNHTPIILDDIISSGETMKKTVQLIIKNGMSAPICVGVHAVLEPNAEQGLLEAGAKQVITCNTIPHSSNGIDLSQTILEGLKLFQESGVFSSGG